MKRAAIILVVCCIVFIAARKIATHNRGSAPPRETVFEVSTTPRPQTIITSLPPLTNLTLRRQTSPAEGKTNTMTQATPQTNDVQQTAVIPPNNSGGKQPRKDLLARVALSLVGVDPLAEEYWVSAINDPSLSEDEREDLIEDLNEEGFEDPKNPTAAELPLIINRLQIIEEYAPFAMDDVNARSFAEAYKDLVNMLARLTSE